MLLNDYDKSKEVLYYVDSEYIVYRRRLVVNQEQLMVRPQAELLIAMINDPNRVDKQYLISRGPRYRSAINYFDLSLHPLGIKYCLSTRFGSFIIAINNSACGLLINWS